MFADTVTITINSVARTFTKVNQDGYTSEWFLRETSSEYVMKIRHSSYLAKDRNNVRVDRHNVEVVQTVFPVAPATVPTVRKTYSVFEVQSGDDLAVAKPIIIGVLEFTSNSANMTKLLNKES
jgi:hypothetical protein